MADDDLIFATVSMAEILIGQNLLDQAKRVINRLRTQSQPDPRIDDLLRRISEISKKGSGEEQPVSPVGHDGISLEMFDTAVRAAWELTDHGLDLAKRKARYSGKPILRLFTAAVGPRGVRTTTRDMDITNTCAQLHIFGATRPAVHVAAVGFLAVTGEFVPLARSGTLSVSS